MHMSNESLLVILVVGIVAGWLAGQIVRGTGFGLVGDLILGTSNNSHFTQFDREKLSLINGRHWPTVDYSRSPERWNRHAGARP
jgi:hypothetical protein